MVKSIKFFSPDMRKDSSGTLLIDGKEVPYHTCSISGVMHQNDKGFLSFQIEITTKDSGDQNGDESTA